MRHEIRVQTLVLLAAVTFVLALAAFTLLTRDGSLVPVPPVVAGLLLVIIAVAVLYLARGVRRHVLGRQRLDALRAARTVVLAQAAALTGAAGVGWYLGQLAVVAGDLALVANRDRVLPLSLHALAAAALTVAGMVAQHWCRVDRGDDDEPRGERQPGSPERSDRDRSDRDR